MTGFSADPRLTDEQRDAILTVFQDGLSTGFEPHAMAPHLERHVALLDNSCPDDLHLQVLAEDLHNQLRWFRKPAYFLTNALQHLTHRRGSPLHITASLLFADAQVICANDMAFHSTEVAWRTLKEFETVRDTLSREWLDQQREEVLYRLRIQHRFYEEWARPFDYLDVNPLVEHMYNKLVIRDLREAYPMETDNLSSALPQSERAVVLLQTADTAKSRGDSYHWITARRLAAGELDGVRRMEEAERLYRSCLESARENGLEAEIGHLLRSHGWNLMQLGRLPEAAEAMEEAVEHEQPLALFGYWSALAARELGDIRSRRGRDDALDAYRQGREALDAVVASPGPPAGATIKRQMLRSYADNALVKAVSCNMPFDALAEIEASGPRSLGETLAEVRAAAKLLANQASDFLTARTVFHRHLTSVPSTFESYLADIDAEYDSRRRYLQARESMPVLPGRRSDEVAQRLMARIGDDRLVLAFALGPRPTSCAVLVDLADGSMQSVLLGETEETLRQAHRRYATALADADELVGESATDARGEAVLNFTAAIQRLIAPVMALLASRATGRRLVVVPQMQLHAVPFPALTSVRGPLLDLVADIAVVPTLGLLAELLEAEQPTEAGVTVFHSSEVPLYEGCLGVLAESRHARVVRDADESDALGILQSATGDDVLFACHGMFVPNAPAASHLTIAPSIRLTLGDVTGSVMLPSCRSVTLGACETGLSRAELGSEFIGLPGTLLGAGVSAVVASLWRVDQIASNILVGDLIARLKAKPDVPAALAEAQRNLRLMTGNDVAQWLTEHLPGSQRLAESFLRRPKPFQQPLHWAGFAASAVGPPKPAHEPSVTLPTRR